MERRMLGESKERIEEDVVVALQLLESYKQMVDEYQARNPGLKSPINAIDLYKKLHYILSTYIEIPIEYKNGTEEHDKLVANKFSKLTGIYTHIRKEHLGNINLATFMQTVLLTIENLMDFLKTRPIDDFIKNGGGGGGPCIEDMLDEISVVLSAGEVGPARPLQALAEIMQEEAGRLITSRKKFDSINEALDAIYQKTIDNGVIQIYIKESTRFPATFPFATMENDFKEKAKGILVLELKDLVQGAPAGGWRKRRKTTRYIKKRRSRKTRKSK